jgi:type VII secretion-associated serine protease mycosin
VTSNIVELKGEASAPELLKKVKADPTVELASLNYRRSISAVPNDPYYNGYQKNALTTARVPQAWDLSKTTGSQIVAVIDTGVDAGHPDLAGRLLPGYNATSPNRGPIDDNGHGTMTLGIIAASANNGIGVAGVGWAAKAIPVKVLDKDGNGWDVDIAEGIDWAVAHGATVINMSLGGPGYNPVLEQSIVNAAAKGVVLVAASGNEGSGVPQYPAAFEQVFAVGATDPAGNLTEFSSYGDWVDLAAPGWEILSTYPRVVGDPNDIPYAFCTGTSCSAPIVAGVAALVRNKYPTLSNEQVETRLRSLARDAGPRGKDEFYGFGVVDSFAALGGRFTTDFPGGGADGNDQPARATKITGSATAAIETEGDVDWYSVDSAAARNLKVTVTPPVYNVEDFPTNIGPVVDVYDENLKLLGHDQNTYPHTVDPNTGIPVPEVLTATSEVSVPAGTAYIAVRNSNGSRDARTYKVDVAEGGAGGTVTGPAYPLRDTTPVDRTSNVAATVKPTVTFARDVENPSLVLMDAKTGATPAAPGEYVAATRTWTFTPTKPLNEATTYKVVGTATEDGAEVSISTVFTTADLTPQAVTGFAAAGNYLAANLSWAIPATPDLDQVIVRYNPNSKTPTIDTGTLAYAGTGTSVKVTGLAQGVTSATGARSR